MEKYLNNLLNQFQNALGIKNIDLKSESCLSEIADWTIAKQEEGKKYLTMIGNMKCVPSFSAETSEVGKGPYDSIAINTDLTIITPYTEGFEKLSTGLIIPANFRVYGDVPTLIRGKSLIPINAPETNRFITQNPYNQNCIHNWENMHNSGNNNITVGIYGSVYDKDIQEKIKLISDLKDKLDDSYEEMYTLNGDCYCYAISSTRNILTMGKTLVREKEESPVVLKKLYRTK